MKLLTIENRVAKVRLNDAVTPWSADDLIADIERSYGQKAVAENMTVGTLQCSADEALETLEIEINSPGGSVLDGYRVYNSLMQMRGRGVEIIATVNTLAASMGSVILMAANKVRRACIVTDGHVGAPRGKALETLRQAQLGVAFAGNDHFTRDLGCVADHSIYLPRGD